MTSPAWTAVVAAGLLPHCTRTTATLCTAGAATAQDPNDPFSNPGAITATDSGIRPGASRREVEDAVQTRYRQILALWAGGQTDKAAIDLMSLETSVVKDDDAGSRKRCSGGGR